MTAPLYYSAEMVRNLPDDGNRYETVHGELLVSPSPRLAHQIVLQRLGVTLANYLNSAGVEGVFFVDADIQTLHLVVEILSPSSLRADRFTKRRLYQEQRIPCYWIVDLDNRQVEIWTPDALFPIVERKRLTWRHPAATTDCTIDLVNVLAGGR